MDIWYYIKFVSNVNLLKGETVPKAGSSMFAIKIIAVISSLKSLKIWIIERKVVSDDTTASEIFFLNRGGKLGKTGINSNEC